MRLVAECVQQEHSVIATMFRRRLSLGFLVSCGHQIMNQVVLYVSCTPWLQRVIGLSRNSLMNQANPHAELLPIVCFSVYAQSLTVSVSVFTAMPLRGLRSHSGYLADVRKVLRDGQRDRPRPFRPGAMERSRQRGTGGQ